MAAHRPSSNDDKLSSFKLVVFGAGGVGKSSITMRFVSNTFTTDYIPTIEDFYRKTCRIDGRVCSLEILDTAGQEDFSALRDQWVREGDGFVLVYSCTSRQSLRELNSFRERIHLVNEDAAHVPMVIVCNKVDLSTSRQVSRDEGLQFAQQLGNIPLIECSALAGAGCEEVFYTCVREIRRVRNTVKAPAPAPPKKGFFASLCVLL